VKFSYLCTFTEKQVEATRQADAHKYTLFGGSRGPGKSHWLRWYALRRLLKWAAEGRYGVKVGLFCEDYPSLQDRQISKISKWPVWLGELKRSKEHGLGFHLHARYGGGVLLLRNLKDGQRYQSAEFAGIAIDELTKNPLKAFDDLRGSLRWPGIDDTFFVAATNPNGKYFKWVRRAWVERDFTGPIAHLAKIADQFSYVKALPEDNPYLNDDYWTMLNSLPRRLREAWRDGSWYVAVEGLVFDSFGEANITNEEPDPNLPIELGIDDGYIDPRATLFIQKKGNHILVFDELYETKKLEEETVDSVVERCEERYDGKLPEMAAVSHEATSLRRRLREANIPARNWMAVKAGRAKSTRKQAIQATRALIQDGNQYRALKVHSRCKNLLDEITSGYRNKEDPAGGYQDEPQDGNDHACEALEGWVWLRARRYVPQVEEN
jgi:hypothetical protein